MKIRVNYDLMDKIRESKTGISLRRTRNEVIVYTLLFSSIDVCLNLVDLTSIKDIVNNVLMRTVFNSVFFPFGDYFLFSTLYKNKSIDKLKDLSKLLRAHYINTDYELLQKAYNYETSYKFVFDEEKIPRLKQEKYIMVPVVDRDGEKEVSLVQEHLLGSKDYELSYGSPTKSKVLKPVYNGI